MFEPDQYSLLDFGDGRKLERFGTITLDRPCPAAEGTAKARPPWWGEAEASYVRGRANRGQWRGPGKLPGAWTIRHGPFALQVRPTEFGHLGVFPEQAENWDWLARQVQRADGPPRVLNLFAYTGGSTLAAAAAGAEVVHVDAARTTVQWARGNAEISGLQNAPIRWIVDDAVRFVQREVRRGRQYQGIILDPPTYGHGPKGQVWQITRDLTPLLRACAELWQKNGFFLVTCHSPGYGPADLGPTLQQILFGNCRQPPRAKDLVLTARSGRSLHAGTVARWPA